MKIKTQKQSQISRFTNLILQWKINKTRWNVSPERSAIFRLGIGSVTVLKLNASTGAGRILKRKSCHRACKTCRFRLVCHRRNPCLDPLRGRKGFAEGRYCSLTRSRVHLTLFASDLKAREQHEAKSDCFPN